jgi:hypothetical protein
MQCSVCSAAETPRWRFLAGETLCNACGLARLRGGRKRVEPKQQQSAKKTQKKEELLGTTCPLCYRPIIGHSRRGPPELGRVCGNCGNFFSRLEKIGSLLTVEEMRQKRCEQHEQ